MKQTRKLLILFTVFSGLALSAASLANTNESPTPPEQVVQNAVNAIVNNIQDNRLQYQDDNDALHAMLERNLLPALHVPRMANLILGRKHSRLANDAQKAEFSAEFQTFLMKSYATVLLEYTGEEQVVYQPVVQSGADKVKIIADLVSASGNTTSVTMFMSNRGDTQWRAYNMDIAGINFIATYRATFGGILDTKGIDGLITDLRAKNAKL